MKELYDSIYKRKSFHLFNGTGSEKILDSEIKELERFFDTIKPLFSNIKTSIKIVPESQTTCDRGAEYCILFYSEVKDGYLQNIGYIGEQIDLFLVSKNIGTLWYGLGRVEAKIIDNLRYVIMLAIKKVDSSAKFRKDMYKIKRKELQDIWQGNYIDSVSDIIRFSPSACNSQPWRVVKNNSELYVYRFKKEGRVGIMSADNADYFNQIDIGIFLCFLDVCLEHNNTIFIKELFCEKKINNELFLNAKYSLE